VWNYILGFIVTITLFLVVCYFAALFTSLPSRLRSLSIAADNHDQPALAECLVRLGALWEVGLVDNALEALNRVDRPDDLSLYSLHARCGKALPHPGTVERAVFRDGCLVGYIQSGNLLGSGIDEYRAVDIGDATFLKRNSYWITYDKDSVLAQLPSHVFRLATLLLTILFLSSPTTSQAQQIFAPSSLSQYGHIASHIAIRPGSSVCSIGYIESIHNERDGDIHVWLCESPSPLYPSTVKLTMADRRHSCILGEIVPSNPLPQPTKHAHVIMCGNWIDEDIAHKWTELHPVTSIESIAPQQPAKLR